MVGPSIRPSPPPGETRCGGRVCIGTIDRAVPPPAHRSSVLEHLNCKGDSLPTSQAESSHARLPPRRLSAYKSVVRTRAPLAADGMAKGHGAAVHVDALPIEAQLLAVGQHLCREGLVDLKQIIVRQGSAGLGKQVADGQNGA